MLSRAGTCPILLLLALGIVACRTTTSATTKSGTLDGENLEQEPGSEQQPGPIRFASYLDINDFRGQTFLQFMRDHVKPALDKVATEGYRMGDGQAVALAYELSDTKVKKKVDKFPGGLQNVKAIADKITVAEGANPVSMSNLAAKIHAADPSVDEHDLVNFLGLASGGGVKIKFDDKNFGLNVHYAPTEQRSGRSYGVGPTRGANDASDKQYLDDLEKYSRDSRANLAEFYKTLLESLLNNDTRNYSNVLPDGQTVLTDFLAVYTAEQDRNLMDGNISLHWDAALLEVTLLAAFHAGQDTMTLYYKNPSTQNTTFTDKTFKQKPCANPSQSQTASMSDYWQFSRNINSTSNCKRSGINITKNEFRLLGKKITSYVYNNQRDIFDTVKASMDIAGTESNLFKALSVYLINANAPASIDGEKIAQITNAWVTMLAYIADNANAITSQLGQTSQQALQSEMSVIQEPETD